MRLSSTWQIWRLKNIAPLERYLTTISPWWLLLLRPSRNCGMTVPWQNQPEHCHFNGENVIFTNGFLWVSDFCNQWIWEFRGFNCGFSKKHFRPAFHCCFWGLLWTTCQPLQPSCHGVNQHLFLNLRSQHRSFWMVFLRRATGEVVKHRAVN